jgi:hypothetical protein
MELETFDVLALEFKRHSVTELVYCKLSAKFLVIEDEDRGEI